MFVLSTSSSCYWSQKYIFYSKNFKPSQSHHSAGQIHRNTQKSLICMLLNQNHSLNAVMPKKSEIDFYNSFSPVYYIALGTSTCCQLKVFLPSKRKGFLQQTVDDELSALARVAFYENLLIWRETSV